MDKEPKTPQDQKRDDHPIKAVGENISNSKKARSDSVVTNRDESKLMVL